MTSAHKYLVSKKALASLKEVGGDNYDEESRLCVFKTIYLSISTVPSGLQAPYL